MPAVPVAAEDELVPAAPAGVPGPRTSVWANPEAVSDYPEDLVAAMEVGGQDAVPFDRPVVVKVAQAREIVGQPIVDAITGQDSAASADAANTAFQEFLDDEEK